MTSKSAISAFFSFLRLGILCILFFYAFSFAHAQIESRCENKQIEQLSEHLEKLAAELSIFVTDKESQAFLVTQIMAAQKTNTIVLREALAAAARQDMEKGAEQLFGLASGVQRAETIMKRLEAPIPRLDLSLPVEAHRNLLQKPNNIYVVAAPLADESKVQSITAYTQGKRITLSTDEPPKYPTLVIAPAQKESLDPDYPLTTVEEPGDERNKERIIDDYVGIPWILIKNDHEEWWRGNPQIYIHYRRWISATGVFLDTRVDLNAVNKENKWYWLGDPNTTYIYLDNRYHRNIELIVYEEDWPDSDDVVGVFNFNWRNLPYGGYIEGTPLGTTRDARIRLDKD